MAWKREYPGRYTNGQLAIERSDRGGWNVINLTTGRVLDNLPTKREAMRIYR